MLPNHSALRVAETFRVLEALHPGRIDLGIGRAPGTDGVTAAALRRSLEASAQTTSPQQLGELLAYGGEGFPAGHPFASVRAVPADVPLPPIWILGSSDYGAQAAAALGVGFAFARHMNPRGAEGAMRAYRDVFRPSPAMERADRHPRASRRSRPRRPSAPTSSRPPWASAWCGCARGGPTPLPSPEEAAAHRYTPDEQDQIRRYRRAQVLGDPAAVRDEILALAELTAADEVMVMTAVHDHGERLRSYELIAGALAPAAAPRPKPRSGRASAGRRRRRPPS